MAGSVGKIAVRAGYDGSDLSRGLRRSKGEMEEFAKNAKRAFQFGVGEAGIGVLRSGVESITAAMRFMRGDTEAAWEALRKIPFGIGALIESSRGLWKELSGEAAAQQAKENLDKIKEKVEAIRKESAKTMAEWAKGFRADISGAQQPADKERVELADRAFQIKTQVTGLRDLQSRTKSKLQKDIIQGDIDAGLEAYRAVVERRKQIDAKEAQDRISKMREAGRAKVDFEKQQEDAYLRRMDDEQRAMEESDRKADEFARAEVNRAQERHRAQLEALQDEQNIQKAREEAAKSVDAVNREIYIAGLRGGDKYAQLQADMEVEQQGFRDRIKAAKEAGNQELAARLDVLAKIALAEHQKRKNELDAERRQVGDIKKIRRDMLDISGQDLTLGAPNNLDTSRYLRPMLGALNTMARRGGSTPRWTPIFGG